MLDIAGALGVQAEEIFFTGSGTEADNWAIKGVAYANKFKELVLCILEKE